MVIDDSKTIRRTAETLLKREGCEVVTATEVVAMNTLSQCAITDSASAVHGWPQCDITSRRSGKWNATSS